MLLVFLMPLSQVPLNISGNMMACVTKSVMPSAGGCTVALHVPLRETEKPGHSHIFKRDNLIKLRTD